MKLNILCEFDAVLMIEKENFILEKKQSRVEIDFQEKERITCFVYPTNEKLFPYVLNIEKKEEDIFCESPHVKIFQVNENCFEIYLKKRFAFCRRCKWRIVYLENNFVVLYFGACIDAIDSRQYAKYLKRFWIVRKYDSKFCDFLALRRKEYICRICTSCVKLVRWLKSYIRE